MTRINAGIHPSSLTDQHLIAEYNEIGLFFMSLRRSLKSKNGVIRNQIPEEFTLNAGHVKFFYDKLLYVQKRYESLKHECRTRSFNLNEDRVIYLFNEFPLRLYNDWSPDAKSDKIIKERIILRLRAKPDFYRYYKQKIEVEYFIKTHYPEEVR